MKDVDAINFGTARCFRLRLNALITELLNPFLK